MPSGWVRDIFVIRAKRFLIASRERVGVRPLDNSAGHNMAVPCGEIVLTEFGHAPGCSARPVAQRVCISPTLIAESRVLISAMRG